MSLDKVHDRVDSVIKFCPAWISACPHHGSGGPTVETDNVELLAAEEVVRWSGL